MALTKNMPIELPKKDGECGKSRGCGGSFGKKIMLTLAAVALVYLTFYLGSLIRSNMKKYNSIGMADKMERTITVNGTGKVTGKNDIATVTIGYSNTDKDVAVAQTNNSLVMDKILAELKKLGIAEKDLLTDYSIYPNYNYTQAKGQELTGYKVSQSVTVKIRDLSKITAVLSLAGEYGATEVSGLNFTIDEPENLKTQARTKAVADAKLKAQNLSDTLGVSLVSVVAYNEYEGDNQVYPMPMMDKAIGLGGSGGPGPEVVASGSKDVTMNVSITYEIMPQRMYSRW